MPILVDDHTDIDTDINTTTLILIPISILDFDGKLKEKDHILQYNSILHFYDPQY